MARGLSFAALSGVMALAAFFAAFVIRIRRWPDFGIRRVSVYRTGSIWPGVVVHAVNNGVGTVLPLLLS